MLHAANFHDIREPCKTYYEFLLIWRVSKRHMKSSTQCKFRIIFKLRNNKWACNLE